MPFLLKCLKLFFFDLNSDAQFMSVLKHIKYSFKKNDTMASKICFPLRVQKGTKRKKLESRFFSSSTFGNLVLHTCIEFCGHRPLYRICSHRKAVKIKKCKTQMLSDFSDDVV